jgi:hypothetical protein
MNAIKHKGTLMTQMYMMNTDRIVFIVLTHQISAHKLPRPLEAVAKVETEPSPSGRGQGEGIKINVLPCLSPLTPTPLPRGEGLLRQPPLGEGGLRVSINRNLICKTYNYSAIKHKGTLMTQMYMMNTDRIGLMVIAHQISAHKLPRPLEAVAKVEKEPSPSGRGQGEGIKINVLPCLFPLTPTPLPRGKGLLRHPPLGEDGVRVSTNRNLMCESYNPIYQRHPRSILLTSEKLRR